MKNSFISYNEMKVVIVIGVCLRIELKGGEEVKISFCILKLEDIKILMNELKEHIEVL